MYYYKARIYSPRLDRFLQTDPIGYDDQINLYAYVSNDPVNRSDPSGEAIETVWDLANAAIGWRDTISKVRKGDWSGAAAAALGATFDTAAAALPGVPGGASTLRRIATESDGAIRIASGLPKPRTGPGTVPKAARDPKRTFSPADRAAKRREQGNQCANACGTKIDETNSIGHHKKRHADGGRTTSDNHAEVCKDCHRALHKPKLEMMIDD